MSNSKILLPMTRFQRIQPFISAVDVTSWNKKYMKKRDLRFFLKNRLKILA